MLRDESNDNHYRNKIRKVLGRISRAIVQTLPTNVGNVLLSSRVTIGRGELDTIVLYM